MACCCALKLRLRSALLSSAIPTRATNSPADLGVSGSHQLATRRSHWLGADGSDGTPGANGSRDPLSRSLEWRDVARRWQTPARREMKVRRTGAAIWMPFWAMWSHRARTSECLLHLTPGMGGPHRQSAVRGAGGADEGPTAATARRILYSPHAASLCKPLQTV